MVTVTTAELDPTAAESIELATAPDRRIETTISTVILTGDRAWKVRKPVAFPFLDQRTVADQRHLCEREVELNSRLAPDVYLGVVEIDDPQLGAARRPATLMRRLPDARRLAALIAAGSDINAKTRDIARTLASFHLSANCGPVIAQSGTPAALATRWHGSLGVLERFAGSVVNADTLGAVRRLADQYIAGCTPLLLSRIATDKIVDGHGDLLADDIFCLDDGPRILDCLEFNDELRYCDVVSDVASLAMDCERLGAPQVGELLFHEYTRYTADVFPSSLAHHYMGYRAMVRCEVACLRLDQGDAASANAARLLLDIAHRHCRLARPAMVLVGGPPGVGKSTVAAGLGDALGWVVLRSDEVRREVVGDEEWAAPSEWLSARFSAGATDATYTEMVTRADELLGRGESVVLDATWASPLHRDQAQHAARDRGATLVAMRCEAPAPVAEARVASRIAAGADISMATVAVARQIAAGFASWPRADALDTGGAVAATLSHALATVRRAALSD
jgi:aminoglycoside phosphotransferase family enzyme/predicted kinase